MPRTDAGRRRCAIYTPASLNEFAGGNHRRVAENGDQIALTPRFHPQYAEPGVERSELVGAVARHHNAMRPVIIRTPGEVLKVQSEPAVALCADFQGPDAGVDHLGPDAITAHGGNLEANPTVEWISQQITEAHSHGMRRRAISSVTATPRMAPRSPGGCKPWAFATGLTPRSPWQNGHVERLIGSIRRECLDHVVVLGERHLRHLLGNYATYYNGARTHLALDKDTPLHRPEQTVGRIASVTRLGGLHRLYIRMA
jgi:hypothetical protein